MICPRAAIVAVSVLALAGCGSASSKSDQSVGAFLTGLPGGQNFTGQGDMGIGIMGNSEGESGPSQPDVPEWGQGRNAIRPP